MERMLTARARTDIEAFVVVDVSRSMLGQGARTRRRASSARSGSLSPSFVSARGPLRSGIDDGSGPPTPLPSVDQDVFQATVERSIGIEKPPPRTSLLSSATSFDALAAIRTQRFFSPRARKRLIVVLTDGESQPVAVERLRSVFLASPRSRPSSFSSGIVTSASSPATRPRRAIGRIRLRVPRLTALQRPCRRVSTTKTSSAPCGATCATAWDRADRRPWRARSRIASRRTLRPPRSRHSSSCSGGVTASSCRLASLGTRAIRRRGIHSRPCTRSRGSQSR